MAASRSLNSLLRSPGTVRSYQPVYEPNTGRQYQPGEARPGSVADIIGNMPLTGGLKEGWAPKIGHIKTLAAQTKVKKRTPTNPLLASASGTTKKVNPFFAELTPSPDSFGLNVPA